MKWLKMEIFLSKQALTDGISAAKKLLKVEQQALTNLEDVVESESFHRALQIILDCSGRVVVSGMGKSGLIGQKIAATLASTGTPAFFMHPGEALHGDLGMTRREDIFLLLSNSGETEVIELLPSLQLLGNCVISISGRLSSTLARQSDAAIVYKVDEEGCPIGLAPMATTTATLVIGDALATALMKARGFGRDDFAVYHPAGSLGRRLLTRVRDLMVTDLPLVTDSALMGDALEALIEKNLGVVMVQNSSDQLVGIISDGDVKRVIKKSANFLEIPVVEVMTRNPKTVNSNVLAEKALREMETDTRLITFMPVVDDSQLIGLLRLHEIIQAKIK